MKDKYLIEYLRNADRFYPLLDLMYGEIRRALEEGLRSSDGKPWAESLHNARQNLLKSRIQALHALTMIEEELAK